MYHYVYCQMFTYQLFGLWLRLPATRQAVVFIDSYSDTWANKNQWPPYLSPDASVGGKTNMTWNSLPPVSRTHVYAYHVGRPCTRTVEPRIRSILDVFLPMRRNLKSRRFTIRERAFREIENIVLEGPWCMYRRYKRPDEFERYLLRQ